MLTLELAKQAQALVRGPLPANAVHSAKLRVLDAIGCALGGLSSRPANAFVKVASGMGGAPEATLLGTGKRVPALTAALSNGIVGHALCFEDTDLESITHPSSSIVMGALAAAEQAHAGGKDLLAAIIAGYQVTVPLARAAGKSHRDVGFHASGTCNAPGTAMAVSEIYKLDAETAARAIALAIEQASGLTQYRGDGGMPISAFHCGHSAQAGVLAAQLAREGFPAPAAALEGRNGFFRVMCGGAEPPQSMQYDGIGILQTSIKAHPVAHIMPGAIDAARAAFSKLSASVEQIQRITVRTFAWVINGHDWREPTTRAQSEVSTQFHVAVGLLFPIVLKDYFNDPYISDPRLKKLCMKIVLEESAEATAAFPREWHYEVTIALADGRSATAKVTQPKGHPDNPIPDADLAAKFHSMADKVIGVKKATRVVDMVHELETVDARELGDLLHTRRKS